MKIGLISDTHHYLDDKVFAYFEPCDEIWHAGDFGSREVADMLKNFRPLVGVYGNIDGQDIRIEYPLEQRFSREGMEVWMIHIAGAPPRYNPAVRKQLQESRPDILVCGHSHILKVIADKKYKNMLYLNPGAAGKQGFHKIRTLLRFDINQRRVVNMEVIELGKRGSLG